MKPKHASRIFLVVFFFLALAGFLILTSTHLTVNLSPSLPHRFFLCLKGLPLKRGELVCLKQHHTAYGTGCVTKRLVALPGDTIACDQDHLIVGGKTYPLQLHTKEGKSLTPIHPQRIPDGYGFVVGDHPRSFDSRYREFGLVPLKHIWGRCWGIGRCTP